MSLRGNILADGDASPLVAPRSSSLVMNIAGASFHRLPATSLTVATDFDFEVDDSSSDSDDAPAYSTPHAAAIQTTSSAAFAPSSPTSNSEYYSPRSARRSDGDTARSEPEFNTAREVIDSSGSSARDSGTGRDQFLSARTDGDDVVDTVVAGNFMPKQYDAARVFSKVRHNRFEEVQKLLEDGLPVDATDDNGNAMLHIACQNGHRRLAKVLLRGGANMNAQNSKGQTPLHFAFAFGYQELGQYLIAKAGADPTVKNHFGLTCYEGLGFKSGSN